MGQSPQAGERARERLRELVDWLEEEFGPVTESELAAAQAWLDKIDAEHDRRRAQRERAAEDGLSGE